MTKFRKGLLASMVGAALMGGMGAAQAITLDTTTARNVLVAGNPGEGPVGLTGGDGILQNFTGFDYNQNGQALIRNFFIPLGATTGTTIDFLLDFQGFANTISSTSLAPDLRVASPGSGVGTYEITAVASLMERATCGNATCSFVFLSLTPGGTDTFRIFFDNNSATFADPVAGTGYTNGVLIASGIFNAEALSTFAANAPVGTPGSQGSGSATLSGLVTFTNAAYINPALFGTTVGTDLRFPGNSAFNRSAFVNNISSGGADTSTQFVLQADARQDFTAVPEPETVALLGLGLLGLGFGRRRKSA